MQNSKILVTGGAGSIGSEIVRQLSIDNDVYFIDNNETAFFDLYEELKQKNKRIFGRIGDVRDKNLFTSATYDFGSPDYIFHAAALKHVTPSGWSPMEYVKTNIEGTCNILDFAAKYESKLVNISTDKVINANSIMGATKKVAEIMVRNANQISVRFGNVMGSRGSVIPIWQRQIEAGEPLTITDEKMSRYMMTIPEAVNLVIKAAEEGKGGEIFILRMGEPVNILKLAQEILKKSGKDVGTKIIGIREGETLDEKLMTEEEASSAILTDNFYILNGKTS